LKTQSDRETGGGRPREREMGREDGKLKSARRKPLRDVSNRGVKSSKSAKNKAEMSPPDDADRVDGDPLDRIIFLHSDISSILRQVFHPLKKKKENQNLFEITDFFFQFLKKKEKP